MYRLVISCAQCGKTFPEVISGLVSEVPCPHCGFAVRFPDAPADEPTWMIAQQQKKVGPFRKPHLAELAASRQLTPLDMVLASGETKWHSAGSVPGLFPAPADETPKLVLDESTQFCEDVLAGIGTPTPHGPLSRKGIKVKANFSLTVGDFQIFRKLGAGGMGAVYLARQRSMDRLVALKVLSDTLANKDTFVNRFLREVTVLAGLSHDNIVNFLGAGQEKGIPFFAMEFIDGFSAAALVKQCGKLAVGDALYIIRLSAEAMSYACTHKIVHRDIKPENIMLTRQGQIKVTDLGLAKPLDGTDLDLTDSGTVMGSPKYMAPEQSRDPKNVDHRADIYALGGVLYFLLTAEEPFKGTTAMELLLAKEKKAFVPARRLNREIPERLDLLIDKALAKEPKYRYQTYPDLIHDLQALGMTNAQLSFDPALVVPAGPVVPAADLVEILLIDDDFDDVCLTKQALDENHIPSNLAVVRDGAEARAYLRREGKFLFASTPGLIIFGSSLNLPDSLLTLQEIKINETLSETPVVMLASSLETARLLAAHGYRLQMIDNIPNDLSEFDPRCLAVMVLKPDA